jgi:hypothetical protein
MGDDAADAIFEELTSLDPESAIRVVQRFLTSNSLGRAATALKSEVSEDPRWQRPASSGGAASSGKPVDLEPPVGEALPVPGTSTRPGRLFDAEPVDPASVPDILLSKPDPVFFGDRDDKRREQSAIEEFPLMARADARSQTSAPHTHLRSQRRANAA